MFTLNSNEPIKVANLQKLTNQSTLNGKQFFQWKLEKLWLFHKARNVLLEKNRDEDSGKYILLDFAKYLKYHSERQKSSKISNI